MKGLNNNIAMGNKRPLLLLILFLSYMFIGTLLQFLIFNLMCNNVKYVHVLHPHKYNNQNMSTTLNTLKLSCWNLHGFSGSVPYASYLLNKVDILVLSEHWLAENELFKLKLIHPDFNYTGKSGEPLSINSQTNHSWGGIAILWRANIDFYITIINIESRRISAVHVQQENKSIFIIGVYLPQSGCGADMFDNELLILEELITRCLCEGEVVILGDFNCHFGNEAGPRGWGKTSPQGNKLTKLVRRLNLAICDMFDCCTGPNYSYYVEGVGMSYIDHVIASPLMFQMMTTCLVEPDDILNTSDHLALTTEFKLQTSLVLFEDTCSRVSWNKMSEIDIVHKYTVQLDNLLVEKSTLLPHLELQNIIYNQCCENPDEVLRIIIEAISEIDNNLPKIKFQKHLKPYWSPELSSISKLNKKAFSEWKAAGRPRDQNNPHWIQYKNAKREFRKLQRQHEYNEEIKCMKEIEAFGTIDCKMYWHIVNKSRKIQRKKISLIKDTNGVIVSDPETIRTIWADYFKNLFTCHDGLQDNGYIEDIGDIENEVNDVNLNRGKLFVNKLTDDEYLHCLQKLKKNKACGCDGVSSEHLIYGGNIFHHFLLSLFNGMMLQEHMPQNLKKGIIIPIPKGKSDPLICGNNRGITLLSTINKLYQHLLLARDDNNINEHIDNRQGAGLKAVSCLHSSLLLKETISYNLEKGKNIFVSFLDTQKAFDTVWHSGLFYKLKKIGIDPKLWRILANMYTNFQCSVSIGGKLSEWFTVEKGVHQGAPFSLWLYKIFVNDLISELNNSEIGASLFDLNVSCVAYADDIALIATYHTSMQKLLHMAFQHSQRWQYKYNSKKCEVICFTHNPKDPFIFWLGNNKIPIVTHSKHLGIIVSNSIKSTNEFISNKIHDGRRALIAMRGVGSKKVPMSTKVSSKLYWSVSVPIITYGLEVTPVSNECISRLEEAHWSVAKQIQGLPPQTANPAVLPQLGWFTMQGYIDLIRLMFIWRILVMPTECIYKYVILRRIVYNLSELQTQNSILNISPIYEIMKNAKKYNLLEFIKNAVYNGEYISKHQWRIKVKTAIYEHEWRRHKVTFELYKNLNTYKNSIFGIALSPWWIHASRYPELYKQVTLLIRLLTGTQPLEESYNTTYYCSACSSNIQNALPHLLFECLYSSDTRNIEKLKIANVCPDAFSDDFERMSPDEKTCFILSGFGGKYVPEFENIYTAFLNYVFRLYEEKRIHLSGDSLT